ncbi:MAG: HDOD domain-containing protein [Nitrosomonas sp.]|uniref:HDOD domain-containing protein n=1 Tax=Nitrosomonas sp. TaxID=42353 RepID=UPI0032F081A8
MLIINKLEFSQNFRSILQQAGQIPPLPETARELFKLRNNPEANLEQLTGVIEKDPSLAAFIMKYARMSIFGYGNRINSAHHAVSLVLGFNTALNLAMGIVSSGCLKLPNHGTLGRIRIWHQTLECAALCRELYHSMTEKHLVDCELIYLSGLFHNFGYLLFGHLYPKEFAYLNDLVTRYPEQEARTLQQQVFGITHDTIGMYLIKAWDLPEEIAVAVAEQNFPDYSGKHASYVKLLAIANRMRQDQAQADGCPYIDTLSLMECLGIDAIQAKAVQEKIRGCQNEFRTLAQDLAA